MTVESSANQPNPSALSNTNPAVLVATPSLIALSNPPLDSDSMTDLIFEVIGGQEMINISRNDLINGQDVLYTPIKNLKDLRLHYNSNNIIRIADVSDTYFKNFSIKIEEKLANKGTGPNGKTVYIDNITGDLIINVANMDADEQVDIEIITSGSTYSDTIYGGE